MRDLVVCDYCGGWRDHSIVTGVVGSCDTCDTYDDNGNKKPQPKTIGDRIRNERAVGGLSRRQLAKQANVSHRTIRYLETGLTKDATVETVRRLAKALKCDPAWLAFGDEQ